MAKNRKIPFGYMMQNGEIVTNPNEVLAVVTIFGDYLAGLSLSEIAAKMEVPYNSGVTWNKNMVKRILENKKYMGANGHPQLIPAETFDAVNEKKTRKATSLCLIPTDLREIRSMIYCAECGHRLFRMGGNSRSEKWDCRNKDCFPFEFTLTDQMLIGAVLNALNTVIANPSLLESEGEIATYKPSTEVVRAQNEINHMLDSGYDFDRVKAELLRLVQLKYDCCTYSDSPRKTAYLQEILSNREQLNTLDIGLLKSCVKRILVSHLYVIEVEFINGTIIQNMTERTENHAGNENCAEAAGN